VVHGRDAERADAVAFLVSPEGRLLHGGDDRRRRRPNGDLARNLGCVLTAGRSNASGRSTRGRSVAEVDALGERFRPWRTLAAAYRTPTV
jgi:hypothetical protein